MTSCKVLFLYGDSRSELIREVVTYLVLKKNLIFVATVVFTVQYSVEILFENNITSMVLIKIMASIVVIDMQYGGVFSN